MSMETDLQALLLTKCARVWQIVAPAAQARPYVVWQPIGGRTMRYVSNVAADKRNTLVQISVWADSSAAATALIRQIEDALCASAAFVAEPQGEALSTYEEDTKLFGAVQRFSITADR